jgi:hypothetical protein
MPASTIVRRGAVVDRHLADAFEVTFPICSHDCVVRGAAWSNTNPGRGFGLKKQMPSVCAFKNFRRADDGTGLCKVDRIAVGKAFVVECRSSYCVYLSCRKSR